MVLLGEGGGGERDKNAQGYRNLHQVRDEIQSAHSWPAATFSGWVPQHLGL
ncbi:predicted protein [Plenodomus lingam JN3]|uniref:Predicted protein n=1 Tax=Leptosphaeria maculans (strain JN3 / isolate v23.1.3 / race Av1-4-5-6-7-8) TaxID=985895 RepID=E4ZVD5_LEPMJ|nr:predicted protein [Plenodomus lingam JN3]CBX95561.1 predicted protein [Plenodomus lingam JN3]